MAVAQVFTHVQEGLSKLQIISYRETHERHEQSNVAPHLVDKSNPVFKFVERRGVSTCQGRPIFCTVF